MLPLCYAGPLLIGLMFNDHVSGKAHRQEEEDKRQVLQLEPVLERVLRLPHRRDGHEEGCARCHGKVLGSNPDPVGKETLYGIKGPIVQ